MRGGRSVLAVAAPVAVRLSGGVLAALFASLAIRSGGIAAFGELSVVLVSNGFAAIIGAGGLGLAVLSADEARRPSNLFQAVRMVPSRTVLSSLLGVVGTISIVAALTDLSRLALFFAGAHTLATSGTILTSQLFRANHHNVRADLFLGRQGGPISLGGAVLAIALAPRLVGEVGAVHLVGCVAVGSTLACALGFGISVVTRARRHTESEGGRAVVLCSLHEQARLASSAAIGPAVAASPIWVASSTLDANLVGLLAVGGQFAAVIGLLASAAQSRFLGHLGGVALKPGDPSMVSLANVHQEARRVLRPISFVVWLALTGAVVVLAISGWSATDIALMASLPFAQSANLLTGMAGAQVQLGGFPNIVTGVGLSLAICNILGGIIAMFTTPLTLPIVVAVAGAIAPFLTVIFLSRRSGINATIFGAQLRMQ